MADVSGFCWRTDGAAEYAGGQGMPEDLSQKLSRASKDRLQFIYAENGYWYDAMETLSQQIDADPDNDRLRSQRSSLLKQVNLPIAAAYDTGMLSK